eukprot:TRINITY_DN19_c0_g1_i1.p2 TRINITY_DN19_c0_g1~~TRINITY_DN19_c0_g1_i1.p2  ORF type:complete len:105 (+),score=20.40 TRINITY_DN19_c0_g1_i1:177-491(+)
MSSNTLLTAPQQMAQYQQKQMSVPLAQQPPATAQTKSSSRASVPGHPQQAVQTPPQQQQQQQQQQQHQHNRPGSAAAETAPTGAVPSRPISDTRVHRDSLHRHP